LYSNKTKEEEESDGSDTYLSDDPAQTQTSQRKNSQSSRNSQRSHSNSPSQSSKKRTADDLLNSDVELLPPKEPLVGRDLNEMPPNYAKSNVQLKKQLRQQKAEFEKLKAKFEAQQGQVLASQRNDSPEDQIKAANSAKKARTKRKGKSLILTSSEEEDPTKDTKEKITEAIQKHVFAHIKFVKGEGTTDELASHIILKAIGHLKKRHRKQWKEVFSDFCVAELNKHRSNVQTAVKQVFKVRWDANANHDIGTIERWEACLTRDIDMDMDQDKQDFAFYYLNIMGKATGHPDRWNAHHKGYMLLSNGRPPKTQHAHDLYITPETEAYALLMIRGNLRRWTAQFQAYDKFPGYQQKIIQKDIENEAIVASTEIKKRLYMEQHNIDTEDLLPANWATDMELAYERAAGSNNMVCFMFILPLICPCYPII